MNHSVPDNQIGLWLLIDRVRSTGRPLGRPTLVPLAEIKLPRVALEYPALINALLEQGLIEGQADAFELTPAGEALMGWLAQQYSLHAWFYNEYYQAVQHSPAHALFCERVYGQDLSQHGMADMAQLHAALDELQVAAGMTWLDFGCGDGRITEYIAAATGVVGVGLDIADQAIRLALARTQARRERLHFYCADIDKQPDFELPGKFDRILAIDSLFFVRDQLAVTRWLIQQLAPRGRLGVFYICPPHLGAGDTPLAQALDSLAVPYRVRDFSAHNTEHWLKKKQTLIELEPMFKAEGNEFLFKNRWAECDGLENFHRYLYLA